MTLKTKTLLLKSSLDKAIGSSVGSWEYELFFSSLTDYNPYNSTADLLDWLKLLNQKQYFHVETIPFSQLTQWYFDDITGDLCHKSGKFFSIKGYCVSNAITGEKKWDQPIIDQPEIGILGILGKKIDGILYFLMQAKAEPGNLNTYQLSPTVQATRSNYLQVHNGLKTKYLEYFNGEKKVDVIIDQYQSEQGARFHQKRNRNVIVITEDDCEIENSPNHKWMTLGQIKSLMEYDNTVNMDSRSIISQISYAISDFEYDVATIASIISSNRDIIHRTDFWINAIIQMFNKDTNLYSTQQLRNKLTSLRYFNPIDKHIVPLKNVSEWIVGNSDISHKENIYFQVMAVRIEANNREVTKWDQPIICQRNEGIIGGLTAYYNGELYFLVQARFEPGLYDLIEFAPTVQCIPQNHLKDNLPKYLDYFVSANPIYQAKQSEEGGRFYQECSNNTIIETEVSINTEQDHFIWINLRQLKQLVKYQQILNVELRSLLAYF